MKPLIYAAGSAMLFGIVVTEFFNGPLGVVAAFFGAAFGIYLDHRQEPPT